MKSISFSANGELFKEVEKIKRMIRDEIHNKSRNISQSPSLPPCDSSKPLHSKSQSIATDKPPNAA